MDLLNYLKTENSGDYDLINDTYEVRETHSINTSKTGIEYTKETKIKKKKKYYDNDVIYEASAIVQKSIIAKFKKYMNAPKVTTRIESEYIYNFDELCAVIDTIEALHPKHKVWFKEVPDMPNTWEVNFEELL